MQHGTCVGVVIDVSLGHTPEGRRIVDVVKLQLREFIRNELENGEDFFYLYHPQLTDILETRGEQVSAVGNYETDGNKFDVEFALKQALYVMAVQDDDLNKLVFLVTNRMQPGYSKAIRKFWKLCEADDIGCHLCVIAIGPHNELPESETVFEVDEPEGLHEQMKELLDYGSNKCEGACGSQEEQGLHRTAGE